MTRGQVQYLVQTKVREQAQFMDRSTVEDLLNGTPISQR